MNDPQVAKYFICEKCNHIFNWDRTSQLRRGKASDGSRICPRCGTEYVRKFRETDLDAILEGLVQSEYVGEGV